MPLDGPSLDVLRRQRDGQVAEALAAELAPWFEAQRKALDQKIHAAVVAGKLTGELAIQFCAQVAEQERLVSELELRVRRGLVAGESIARDLAARQAEKATAEAATDPARPPLVRQGSPFHTVTRRPSRPSLGGNSS